MWVKRSGALGEEGLLCFGRVRSNRAKCECVLYSLCSLIFSIYLFLWQNITCEWLISTCNYLVFSEPVEQVQIQQYEVRNMCIYITAGVKKFFVFLFLLRIWHFGDGALFLFFNLIFYFPHHRLLPAPFTHSLVFASVPLSHIHHLYKFHPNLISWNIVCDRQNNEWAKQMNGCGDWHFLHHSEENPSRQNARFGVFLGKPQ